MKEQREKATKYDYWLSGLVFLTGRKKICLKEIFQETENLYRANTKKIHQLTFLTEREKQRLIEAMREPEEKLSQRMEYCIQNRIYLTVWPDSQYPKRLKNIYNPPYGLFYRGTMPKQSQPAVGVVGARNCSHYGKLMAEKIGCELAKAGVAVISGMAIGVDGAAQRAAVKEGGYSCGVLGCGIDVCYPSDSRQLYGQLGEEGCVLSEYPPHTKPLAMYFPQRNRIISGLSDCVLVVEAKEHSGSLITADFALEQGRDIYAVPGRATDALSQGTNWLIRQGAGIFLNVEDFLKEMHIFTRIEENYFTKQKVPLEKLERLVYSCLGLTPRSLEDLLEETRLSLGVLLELLETLQKKGCVSEIYKNYYVCSDVFV